jgi:BirA family biotin operon repressor/biotin-[acetyl-CoA-carboxylase] ligase
MSVRFLNPIVKLDVVDSTNNYATARLVREGWVEGTTVLAEEQLLGRGQINNRWESEKGKNLLVSIALFPVNLPVQQQFEISKVVSLAVHDVVSAYVGSVSIKWPNDIYVADQKIAGILIENAIMGSEICWVVAGVGLNINQVEFRSDAPNPVSLSKLTGIEFDRDEILSLLLKAVDKWYRFLKETDFQIIDNAYQNLLYRVGVEAMFNDKTGSFTGTILGVNNIGQLIIKKENGELREYQFKEIKFLK